MKKNIVFSTTRQWNPGDEIILKGIINTLNAIGLDFNPIIFNRNPDIRNEMGAKIYRKIADNEDLNMKIIKKTMWENSVKPWMSLDYIDAVVFAGTPEWQGWRNHELCLKIIESKLPAFFIGIDSLYYPGNYAIDSVIKKAKLITVRNEEIIKGFLNNHIHAEYLPCPSLMAATEEKTITSISCIGLIYRGSSNEVTCINGWDTSLYYKQLFLYRSIIKKYGLNKKIIIICHYIDEIKLAQRDFPEIEDILYSFDSNDYLSIYKKCDLIIGSRIHGIGLASSLCIPSIAFGYDERRKTLEGFQTEIFSDSYNDDILKHIKKIEDNISKCNENLKNNKHTVKDKYMSLLMNISFDKEQYDYLYVNMNENQSYESLKMLERADRYLYEEMEVLSIKEAISVINSIIKYKRVLIKGAGKHTRKLLELLDKSVEIIAIIDNNIEEFNNFKVIHNEEIKNLKFDYILVSSMIHERDMINELKELGYGEKILSIYRIVEDNYLCIKDKSIFDI